MVDGPGARLGRGLVDGVLFVIGTLAGLFVLYVVVINVAAALRDEAGDWTQSLFAVVPAAAISVVAFAVRARLRSRRSG